MPHRTGHATPRSLNDNLRLGRLTVPQWAAIGVGAVVLWLGAMLTAGVHDPNWRIALVAVPAVVLVAPILALGRGGIERYPAQALRFAWRRTLRGGVHAARRAQTCALKGGSYATTIYRQARRQARRRQL